MWLPRGRAKTVIASFWYCLFEANSWAYDTADVAMLGKLEIIDCLNCRLEL